MRHGLLGPTAALCVAALLPVCAAAQSNPVTQFLTTASRPLTQNEVVQAACRTEARIQQYAQEIATLGSLLQKAGPFSSSFPAKGIPTADLGSAIGASAFANAVKQDADAERYATTFGLGSMCNTSEMARIAFSQFTFLRNVVNRLIDRDLPVSSAFAKTTQNTATPIPAAVRADRYNRLFGHDMVGPPVAVSDQMALVDTTAAAAYNAASRSDTVTQRAWTQLQQVYGEMYAAPTNGRCLTVDSLGDSTWTPANRVNPITGAPNTCGPVSPGRARQLMPAIGGVSVMLKTSEMQMERADMDLQTAQASRQVQVQQLQTVGQPFKAIW